MGGGSDGVQGVYVEQYRIVALVWSWYKWTSRSRNPTVGKVWEPLVWGVWGTIPLSYLTTNYAIVSLFSYYSNYHFHSGDDGTETGIFFMQSRCSTPEL